MLNVFIIALALVVAGSPAHAHAEGAVDTYAGLIVRGARDSRDVNAARRFAEVLYPRFKLTLMLLSQYQGVQSPAFSGVILDEDGRAVANFKLAPVESIDGVHDALKRALDRAVRFSSPEAWDQLRAKSERGWRVKSVDSLDHLMSVFGVPGSRPTWVFIDTTDQRELWPNRGPAIRRLTKNQDAVALALIRHRDVVYTVADGRAHVESVRSCQADITLTP